MRQDFAIREGEKLTSNACKDLVGVGRATHEAVAKDDGVIPLLGRVNKACSGHGCDSNVPLFMLRSILVPFQLVENEEGENGRFGTCRMISLKERNTRGNKTVREER